jgi:ADP-ribosylglycohydrolase/predicted protein tyrosine phosphatase
VGGWSNHRIAGALVGLAAGDALGAGYEFTIPSPDEPIVMKGGGPFGWEPGEWTDDTQMAICIAAVTATGSLDAEAVGERFLDWYRSRPKDVGIMTGAVLSSARDASDLARVAREYHEAHPSNSAGNGSLMRTAPVALAHLGDDDAIASAAREISALTHADPLCQEACVLWCIAIDRAVREGGLDGVRDGLELLDGPSRDAWAARLDEAEDTTVPLSSFRPNGFVVTALQAAHAAITRTPVPDDRPACCHLQAALRAAVRIGHDTDTVAAIAGQVLGARWGMTATPFDWRRILHGWPGRTQVRDLVTYAVLTARKGEADSAGWPSSEDLGGYYRSSESATPVANPLPEDPDLIVGNVAGLEKAINEHDVDAVVSMCRMGSHQVPDDIEPHEILLVDIEGHNDNLEFVLADIVRAIATLRDEGKRVFLHCVGGTSRTPTVAALYLARRKGISGEEALERVKRTIRHSRHNDDFLEVLDRGLPDHPCGPLTEGRERDDDA